MAREITRRYLSAEELATWLSIPLRTIRRWRVVGYGPRPKKFGRSLRYPIGDVREFEENAEEYQRKRDREVDI